MRSTFMTPSVVHVGMSAVGGSSPGKHAAILTNRPGCLDLQAGEIADICESLQ